MSHSPDFEVNQVSQNYPDIPKEAILKQDLLRLGLRFTEDSLRVAGGYKPKDYFIFSFDMAPLKELEEEGEHLLRAPEEVRFFGGEWDLKPTVFSVRVNPRSPYQVSVKEGKVVLCHQEDVLAETEFHPVPSYYQSSLSSGKKISEIAPCLEWGYLIYLTVFRLCQYWGKEEECQFCDINENYRQQKKAGRPYTGVKPMEDILEALGHIADQYPEGKAFTLTGGSVTSTLQDKNEVEFYLQYAAAIHEKFGGRWIAKAVVQAFEPEDCKRLRDEGGIKIYHPNYEVWEPKLFRQICPGKERYIGRDTWIERIVKSADVFGPENVIPNFVGGVEMAQPYGFTDLHEAVESTRQGLDFFMSRSIMPRFTTWCPEPGAFLKNQIPPPLEYFVKLLQVWRDTMEKYDLPAPPGYGEPGLGKAVFSVSAFMDVIRSVAIDKPL